MIEAASFRIGADRSCEVALPDAPGVAAVHAEVSLEHAEAFLRPLAATRLNRAEVHEAQLRHGDLLSIGSAVKLRILLLPDGVSLPSPRPSRPSLRRLLAPAAVSLLLVATALLLLSRRREEGLERSLREEERVRQAALSAQKRAYEVRIGDLESEFSEIAAKAALRSEVEATVAGVRGQVERAVAAVESNVLEKVNSQIERTLKDDPALREARDAVSRLRDADEAAERVIAAAAGSVCLLQGAYGFGIEKEGRFTFLRESRSEEMARIDHRGETVSLSIHGDGAIYQIEYTGSGFLVGADGLIATNRHIAEPWWKNNDVDRLLREGYVPRFLYLRAFFPGKSEAFAVDRARTLLSEEADVALIGLAPCGSLPPPIPVERDPAIAIGRRVVLLGYPSGIQALLAKTDERLTDSILAEGEFEPSEVLDTLAMRDAIRPIPTQGHIGDLMHEKVLYDAATAVGGSGGPVLNLQGQVVAVNYGILMSFRAANFGVPVVYLARLLETVRGAKK